MGKKEDILKGIQEKFNNNKIAVMNEMSVDEDGNRKEKNSGIVISDMSILSPEEIDEIQNSNIFGQAIESITIMDNINTAIYELKGYTPDEYKRMYKQMENLSSGIDPTWSKAKKFAFLYSTISQVITYDHLACDKNSQYAQDNFENSRNLYNGLMKGSCVCAGFAAILKNACALNGIEANIIYGMGNNSGHAWNEISLEEGKWIQADVTWEDRGSFYFAGTDNKEFDEKHLIGENISRYCENKPHRVEEFDWSNFINNELGIEGGEKYSKFELGIYIDLIRCMEAGLIDKEEIFEEIEKIRKLKKEFEVREHVKISDLEEMGIDVERLMIKTDPQNPQKPKDDIVTEVIQKRKEEIEKVKNENELLAKMGLSYDELIEYRLFPSEITEILSQKKDIKIVKRKFENKIAEIRKEKKFRFPRKKYHLSEKKKEIISEKLKGRNPREVQRFINLIEKEKIKPKDIDIISEVLDGNYENIKNFSKPKSTIKENITKKTIKLMTPELKSMGLSGSQIFMLDKKYKPNGKKVGLIKAVGEELKRTYSNSDGRLSAKKIARYVFLGKNPIKANEIESARESVMKGKLNQNKSKENDDFEIFS